MKHTDQIVPLGHPVSIDPALLPKKSAAPLPVDELFRSVEIFLNTCVVTETFVEEGRVTGFTLKGTGGRLTAGFFPTGADPEEE